MLQRVAEGAGAAINRLRAIRGMEPSNKIPVLGPRVDPRSEIPIDYPVRSHTAVHNLKLVGGPSQWVGLAHHFNTEEAGTEITVTDCAFYNRRNWASRCYRMRANNAVSYTAFFDSDPEHDIYWNVAGVNNRPLLHPCAGFYRIYSENCASQVIQIVERAVDWYGPTPKEDLTPGGLIIVDRLIAVNPGHAHQAGYGRPGFSLSFFETKNPVALIKVLVDKLDQRVSTGCILIERRNRATLQNVYCVVNHLEQPIMKVSGVENFTMHDSFFYARSGQNWISFDDMPPPQLVRCIGETRVHYNGVDQGSVTEYSARS